MWHRKSLQQQQYGESCVYYESLKRELKTKPIYEFWCDERLKTKVEESTRLTCTVESYLVLLCVIKGIKKRSASFFFRLLDRDFEGRPAEMKSAELVAAVGEGFEILSGKVTYPG